MRIIPCLLLLLIAAYSYADTKSSGMTCEITDGVCQLKNKRGAVQVSGRLVDWKKEGLWTFWDAHGVKTVELTFKADVLNGPANFFYSSYHSLEFAGNKKVETRFTDGQMDGFNRAYYPDGRMSMEFEIRKGTPKVDFFNQSEIKTRISDDLSFIDSIVSMVDSSILQYREAQTE